MIAIELREVLGDLTLAEGVVERIVDHRGLQAEARGLIAVNGDGHHRAARLLVGCDVAQLRQFLQLRKQSRRPIIELVKVRILQRVLVLRTRGAAADVDILRRLQKDRGARHLGKFRAQPRDDLVRRDRAFVARL